MTDRESAIYQKTAILTIVLLQVLFCGLTVSAQKSLSHNRAAWHSSAADYNHTAHLATDGDLTTKWISKPGDREWIYIDLGSICRISGITIHRDAQFAETWEILVSKSGEPDKPLNWKKIASVNSGNGATESLKVNSSARYIKFQCIKSKAGKGIEIQEIEVAGSGRIIKSQAQQEGTINDKMPSLSDDHWKIQRSSFVEAKGEQISQVDFPDSTWLPASVPATVLSNYIAAGAVPDPVFSDNQLQISEWFFTSDFWYRKEFVVPEIYRNKNILLNFKGINWKAEVYVNGQFTGSIEGAFTRASFDITHLVTPGKSAVLAVLIHRNDNPGEVSEQHLNDPDGNGGIIGLDSPAYVSSIGWNWLPTIRGRNTGITDDVFLSFSGGVRLKDPSITTILNLPDTTLASFGLGITLENLLQHPVSGTLRISCKYFTADVPVESLKPGETKILELSEKDLPHLKVKNPELWWPNGYGRQMLDTMSFRCFIAGIVSDSIQVTYGVRQYEYRYLNSSLSLFINGYPLLVRGGNWGLPEALLRCDAEKYDLLVRLHRDMNLNMIRNWVGQTSSDAFYDACDRHGIMIFDDFWLANPVDGPHPANEAMFIRNAGDKVKRFRNHASLALWAGRNEGYPPASLDSALRDITTGYDHGRHYISNSAASPVTGLGPYENKDPKWYFNHRGTTFHTEQGIVSVPSVESMRKMMPEKSLWPVNDMWGLHDWTQPRVKIYTNDMISRYGAPGNIEDFCRKAQMLNMEGPKAMMETWQSNRGPGVLVWMTHPAWPSLICQTYDYYLEPTAAYFALKKGSEPVHILWNPVNHRIQAANNTIHDLSGLNAKTEVYDFNGKLIWEKSVTTDLASNSVTDCFTIDYPHEITKIRFIRLTLQDKNSQVISGNFYWSSSDYQDYNGLNDLPEIKLKAEAKRAFSNGKNRIEINLTNPSSAMALMINLKISNPETGERLLPAFWSDNYFSLVPGEKKTVFITPENAIPNDCVLQIGGWNIVQQTFKISKPD
ncbi:MAG: discoidin domain-containing protein [Lentimicrobium sp.]